MSWNTDPGPYYQVEDDNDSEPTDSELQEIDNNPVDISGWDDDVDDDD